MTKPSLVCATPLDENASTSAFDSIKIRLCFAKKPGGPARDKRRRSAAVRHISSPDAVFMVGHSKAAGKKVLQSLLNPKVSLCFPVSQILSLKPKPSRRTTITNHKAAFHCVYPAGSGDWTEAKQMEVNSRLDVSLGAVRL